MVPLTIGRTNEGVFSSRSKASGVHTNSDMVAPASLLDPRPIWATTAENGHPDFFSEASVPVVDTGLSP